MQNAIVTICPNGYISPEVSKMTEALMCGNIIIASQKPDYPYYKNNKFFIYKDENEIPDILNTIRNTSNEELKKIIEDNNKLFKNNIDPIAVAQNIEKKLLDKKFI